MSHKADPGGRFRSDLHRRVAGHLTGPDELAGYTVESLYHRMAGDHATDVGTPELSEVLDELVQFGLADDPDGRGVFRLTHEGFEVLTGSIADEPPPASDEDEATPARLDSPVPLSASVSAGGHGA